MEQVTKIVVIPLVMDEQKRMLAQIRLDESNPKKDNKWELSGGKVEFDETPEQAVVRETKEETGLDVEVVSLWPKLFVHYWTNEERQEKAKILLLPYVCKIVGGELTSHPDDPSISEVRFITVDEVNELDWGAPVDKNLLLEFSKQ